MPMKIFFCYAHEDKTLLNKLKSHLRPLQRQNLIEMWYDRNISAGQLLRTLEVENLGTFFPTFSPDGQLLAVGCVNGEIILWQSSTGKLLYILEEEDYTDSLFPVFSPDGQLLVASCNDGKVRLWSMV